MPQAELVERTHREQDVAQSSPRDLLQAQRTGQRFARHKLQLRQDLAQAGLVDGFCFEPVFTLPIRLGALLLAPPGEAGPVESGQPELGVVRGQPLTQAD